MVTPQQYVHTAETVVRDHTPYVYGGTSLSQGCDCSGMLYGTNEALGLTLEARTSQAMFADWPEAPGPALGVAVMFDVPSDGTAPGDQPGHVGLCLNTTQMVEEPHTGAFGEIVAIPNIPDVESIMGYRYVPGVDYTPVAPAPPSYPQEILMGLPTGCTDDGAVYCQIREWYTTYRDDPMAEVNQQILLKLFQLPATEQLNGVNGFGGSPDLLLAYIIDQGNQQGHLRPQFVNAT
jgi:hypothetical protein